MALPVPGVTPDGEWAPMLNAEVERATTGLDYPTFAGTYFNAPTPYAGYIDSVQRSNFFNLQPLYLLHPVPVDQIGLHIESTGDPANLVRLGLYKQTAVERFEKVIAFGDLPATPYEPRLSGSWVLPAGVHHLAATLVPGVGAGDVGVGLAPTPLPYPLDIYSYSPGSTAVRMDCSSSQPAVIGGEGSPIYATYVGLHFGFRFRRA